MTEEHASSSDNQEGLAAKLVEEEDGGKGEDNLKNTSHTSGEKGCFRGRETELKKRTNSQRRMNKENSNFASEEEVSHTEEKICGA